MSLRVIIPTAGLGKRLKNLTKNLNKSLITLNNKPVISHIIDSFKEDTEFVIPLGFEGKKVQEYLNLAYPKKKFFFVKIEKFKGPGSGLGLTMLKCKKHLQKPFVFVSCDTIFLGNIPDLKNNWIGYDNSKLSNSYRKMSIKTKSVERFYKKTSKNSKLLNNYIGLAGIKDYKEFWNSMEHNKEKSIKHGEVVGLSAILNKGVKAYKFKWYDTGNLKSLKLAKKKFKSKNYNVLEKDGEAIWFLKNYVIKYSNDLKFIKSRVLRQKILRKYTPKIINYSKHFYVYKKINGDVLSNIITNKNFLKLLNYLDNFWKNKQVNQKKFNHQCLRFYKNKTFERVKLFKKKYKKYDKKELINGKKVDLVFKLLDNIDWVKISNGKAVNFHGDLHFENILFAKTKFMFLDWRQDFDGRLDVGDIYYDLAKIMHGILVSHQKVIKNEYNYKQGYKYSKISISLSNKYRKILKTYIGWISSKNFDLKKVIQLTALIYLNIAPLHHYPYSVFLFKFGKLLLNHNDYYKNI